MNEENNQDLSILNNTLDSVEYYLKNRNGITEQDVAPATEVLETMLQNNELIDEVLNIEEEYKRTR